MKYYEQEIEKAMKEERKIWKKIQAESNPQNLERLLNIYKAMQSDIAGMVKQYVESKKEGEK